MKNNIRKILCAALVLVMLLSLSGCGIGSVFSITKTAKAMSKIDSASMSVNLDIAVEMLGSELPVSINTNVDFTVEPLRSMVTLDLPEQLDNGSFDKPIYAEYADGKLNLYYGAEINGSTLWAASSTEMEEPQGQIKLDLKTALGLYLKFSDSFEKDGTEKYGSFDATHYSGIIPEKVLSELLAQNSAEYKMGELELSTEDVVKILGDMPVDFWIDNASDRIVGFRVDMSKAVKQAMAISSPDASAAELMAIKHCLITVSFTDFNNIDVIEIPEEARAALKAK